MANYDTVEYLVKVMLRAGISREQILVVSRDCACLLGVTSETEAERITAEYLDKHEKEAAKDRELNK